MREKSAHPNMRIVAFAAARHNVITRSELAALGFDDKAVYHRVASGLLRRLHPGVYAVGPTLTPRGSYFAAVRSAGRDAVLTHRAGAALQDLFRYEGRIIDVTVPRTSGARTRAYVCVHRTVRPIETTVRDGIPVTTVARTLADLAEVVPLRKLEKALEQAARTNRLDVRAIEAVAAAHPGRRGPALVARLVRMHATDSFTRSDLEDAFLVFCDEHGIPRPAMNARVDGIEVDAVWVDRRLVVELDSWTWHKTQPCFRADRAKSRRLTVLGWTVLRVTDAELDQEPLLIADEINALRAA